VEQLVADACGDLCAIAPALHVLMRDDDFAGLALPLSAMASQSYGTQAAEVDQLRRSIPFSRSMRYRSLQRARHDRAIR
jgi:hypothetical protein